MASIHQYYSLESLVVAEIFPAPDGIWSLLIFWLTDDALEGWGNANGTFAHDTCVILWLLWLPVLDNQLSAEILPECFSV